MQLSESINNPLTSGEIPAGQPKNWGGKRHGAGRKRKVRPPPTGPSEPQFLHSPKVIDRVDFSKGGSGLLSLARCPKQRGKLITSGSIGEASCAFIYIGRKSDSVLKIGMTTRPEARCRELGVKLLWTIAVVGSSARMVETYAHQELGALQHDTEWVKCSYERAVKAVCLAWRKAERIAHVDPRITPDEARRKRVAICADVNILGVANSYGT